MSAPVSPDEKKKTPRKKAPTKSSPPGIGPTSPSLTAAMEDVTARLVEGKTSKLGGVAKEKTPRHVGQGDYEERREKKKVGSKDVLLAFPEKDVEVVNEERKFRAVQAQISQDQVPDGFQRSCVRTYYRNWVVYRRRYESLGGKTRPRNSMVPSVGNDDVLDETPPKDGSSLPRTNVDEAVLRDMTSKVRAAGGVTRGVAEVFTVYSPQRKEKDEPSDPRTPPAPFPSSAQNTRHFLVAFKDLKFNMPKQVEPVFCQAFLYDVNARVRVSEAFMFDFNGTSLLATVPDRAAPEKADKETSGRMALFSVAEPSPHLHLVVYLEKVVSGGDSEAAGDLYAKGKAAAMKPKALAKEVKNIETLCARYGRYLQLFGWSAMPLYGGDGDSPVLAGMLQYRNFLRVRSDHCEDRLADLIRKMDRDNKAPIEALMTFEASHMDEEAVAKVKGRVDSMLLPVHPVAKGADIVRELDALLTTANAFPEPFTAYINVLHIDMLSVNFSHRKDGGNVKNVCVSVELRHEDADLSWEGLPAVYGGWHEPKLVKLALSDTGYHSKKPDFHHSAKLQLPLALDSRKHHLLFRFYNIDINTKGKGETAKPIGFAWLDLFSDDGVIVPDDTYQLPVAQADMPAGYRNPSVRDEEINWVDHRRPLFSVRTALRSSMYAQDPMLSAFFAATSKRESGSDALLLPAVHGLKSASQTALVRFFTAVLDELFTVMCSCSKSVAMACMSAVLFVLKAVELNTQQRGRKERNAQLFSYVYYLFDNAANATRPLYEVLVEQMDALVHAAIQQPEDAADSTRFMWFLFDLVIKSMVLKLNAEGQLASDMRAGRFSDDFYASVTSLVCTFVRAHARGTLKAPMILDSRQAIALFLKDLMSVGDRGEVFRTTDAYCEAVEAAGDVHSQYDALLDLLRTLIDHEHFVQLNFPVTVEMPQATGVVATWQDRHYVASLLITKVCSTLSRPGSDFKAIRRKAVTVLRGQLWKHDLDQRYADTSKRQVVAALYFPLVVRMLEHRDRLAGLEQDELADWMACFVWVVRNVSEVKVLRPWWKSDAVRNVQLFASMVMLALGAFKETNVRREVYMTIVGVVEMMMEDFKRDLQVDESYHMTFVFPLVTRLLDDAPTVSVALAALPLVRYFVTNLRRTLFRYQNTTYCGELAFSVMRLCNYATTSVRSQAATMLAMMVQENLRETNNIKRMHLQSVIATSRLTSVFRDLSYLRSALDGVQRQLQRQVASGNSKMCGDMISRIRKVIDDSEKLHLYEYDPEMTADIYYQIASSYSDSPDLRVAWLQNLGDFHVKQGNLEEAAMVHVHIAALISQYLTMSNGAPLDGIPETMDEFAIISPNVGREANLPRDIRAAKAEGMYNPKIFSEEGLSRMLAAAADLAQRSKLYELVIDIYKFIQNIHQRHRDYKKLAECFARLRVVCADLVASNEAGARLFSKFYRVGFFGEAWRKDLRNAAFIYKEPATVLLSDFSQRLKASLGQKYGEDSIELVSNVKQINTAELKKNVYYFQVVAVNEFFGDDDKTDRKLLWDRKFNINQFVYDTPFTKAGKAHADIKDQWLRRNVLRVQENFPHVRKRSRIVDHVKVELSPIEAATELIVSKSQALCEQLYSNAASLRVTQALLQGTVLAAVNVGPLHVAEVFLAGNPKGAHEDALREAFIRFAGYLRMTIILERNLINREAADNKTLLEFQTEVEQRFEELKNRLLQYVPDLKV